MTDGILRVTGDGVTFENMTLPDHIQIQGAGTRFINCTFVPPRKSTCCGFYPAWDEDGREVCASCLTPVEDQPTEADVERERALDDDADNYLHHGEEWD